MKKLENYASIEVKEELLKAKDSVNKRRPSLVASQLHRAPLFKKLFKRTSTGIQDNGRVGPEAVFERDAFGEGFGGDQGDQDNDELDELSFIDEFDLPVLREARESQSSTEQRRLTFDQKSKPVFNNVSKR